MTTLARKEIEKIVERKVLEMLRDPDAGRELKKSFVSRLRRSMHSRQKLVPHEVVMRKYDLR